MYFKKTNRWLCMLAAHCLVTVAIAQQSVPVRFTVSMPEPANHTFHVTMDWQVVEGDTTRLKLPDWQPGYYQLMDYASNVDKLVVQDGNGRVLPWVKSGKNGWAIAAKGIRSLHVEYDVKTTRKFVAASYLDEEHAYLTPGSLFMHEAGKLKTPSEVTIKPFSSWNRVATGLDAVPGKAFTYIAPDFDILYDSPLLVGNLEELPGFKVKGIPHRFIGYKLGDFDRAKLMSDIQKIVEKASSLIGDIPYKHYTFIAIGPGQGGIEHLNSTTISFSGDQLAARGWNGMLGFITHEYFHHYNVKRIRPIELGPFDYDKGSKTNMLWVSEGLTVYYEPLIMRAAGLMGEQEFLDFFKKQITNVETKPGRLFQTLAQASAETWSDGPFGRTGDAVNKTISYYQKGPVVGLLFDLAIRYETRNKRSLDDVMRQLYQDFYIKEDRGFTEEELRATIESVAGRKLDELFSYIYTTTEPDYKKYLGYAGLEIDVTTEKHYGTFEIRKKSSPSALEREIFRSWSRGE
ncbi:putative metalloprotease with PDZ domain [Dyadobacter sp. BE34]|uniref:Metalloprotease with PDZ domain n=1 Tax=Dyadobacter fermentans TaxID=94254 RepID=A0ABU1QVR8_9BACT|nr:MULTISPECIES: M61 family peptidase [Dyadobacter]MDR6805252.1 putative metalloprotease with PDZ domain [Dyadobacter fermentans]MDR7042988.1 putative metalloprotease with PDZ domain [Dyadobacter sp. BE242]MDR7197300.1 putative metalloprotease with PDZ domain [Dyadobacter sp. BE34]MDR7215265.1 putative metalloprotease with PDZ domain [Dyadobacter sp. BE31]MDR7262801.1 putative metalloprotease with PDZ domain [Dyadobacter sp. BE32]